MSFHKHIIGFKLLYVRYTTEVIVENVLNITGYWNLGSRVISLTLDNASVNTAIITLIKPKLGAHKDELLHQCCMCHIINLIVKAREKIVDKNIKNIRDAAQFFRGYIVSIEKFRRF